MHNGKSDCKHHISCDNWKKKGCLLLLEHTFCYVGCVQMTAELFKALSQNCRSQWPRGVRRTSTAARLLRSWVRIPPGVAWMFVCCECYVMSGRGLCDELITRPEESYRLWCVVVCDLETSKMRRSCPALGRSATENKRKTKTVTELL